MVIKIIDIPRSMFVELKNHTPIPAYFNCPITFQLTGKLVQSEARKIHILRFVSSIQAAEN